VPALWPEPDGVTTLSFPVEASVGTSTVIFVADTVTGEASTPSKRTLVAPPKAFPYTLTVAPTAADDGANDVTRGSTKNVAPLVAVPPEVVTEIAPVIDVDGTVSRSCAFDSTENAAPTPFTFTALTPPKPAPPT